MDGRTGVVAPVRGQHSTMWGASKASLEMSNPGLEALYYFANAADLVELDLELVDFAQDGMETGDFGVGHLYRIASAVVLDLGSRLGLLRELQESYQRWAIFFRRWVGLGLRLTACQRCWMEYMRRSKWALSACRLVGSRRRRPWLEACDAAREEELPCWERAIC